MRAKLRRSDRYLTGAAPQEFNGSWFKPCKGGTLLYIRVKARLDMSGEYYAVAKIR